MLSEAQEAATPPQLPCSMLPLAELLDSPWIGTLPAGIAQQPQQQHLDDSIAQILEVLPGYGRGFLAACLDASDDDPRQVIHQLLEGSLPKHLGKMDPHLTHWQRPQAGAASQRASAQPPTQGLGLADVL